MITLTEIPSCANISAAFRASAVISPVAAIVTSFPSLTVLAIPIWKSYVASSNIVSTSNLPILIYTGPLYSAAANTIFLVSTASAGDNTTIPGIALINAISSTDW